MIKFRAWDKESKTMGTVRRITWTNGDITDVYLENIGLRRLDQVILMQSTSLKEKYGVEIFDGDILSRKTHIWMYGSNLNEWVTESYPVVWQDGGWYLNEEPLAFILEEGVYRDGFRRTALEVIGNIWEDGDLLDSE